MLEEQKNGTIPNWVKKTIPPGAVGSVVVAISYLFLQHFVGPLTQSVNKANERLHAIEKKTETLIAIGNLKMETMATEQARIAARLDQHVSDPEIHQTRFSRLEAKISRLELRLEQLEKNSP